MKNLIIDTNCSADAFSNNCSGDLLPIMESIYHRKCLLAYGGTKLLREYGKIGHVVSKVVSLDRNGLARKYPSNLVDNKENELRQEQSCVSDDEHIVALAMISNTKLLCSKDQALHTDFKQIAKGAVYQNISHRKLLR